MKNEMHLSRNQSHRLRCHAHCVKNIRVRSFSGPYFAAFKLNMERQEVSLRIFSHSGKQGPEKLWALVTHRTLWAKGLKPEINNSMTLLLSNQNNFIKKQILCKISPIFMTSRLKFRICLVPGLQVYLMKLIIHKQTFGFFKICNILILYIVLFSSGLKQFNVASIEMSQVLPIFLWDNSLPAFVDLELLHGEISIFIKKFAFKICFPFLKRLY